MGLTRIRAEQISDIDYKQAVRVVLTTNITLAGGAPSAVDGVNLLLNDRVLVTGQNTGSQNGLYRVQSLGTGSNGTWVRTSDGNAQGEIESGMLVMVTEGEVYKDTLWKLATNNPITLGVTALTFVLNTDFGFGNIYANGTGVTATVQSDVLTLAAGSNMTIVGNATTKTITFSSTGGGGGSGTAITNGDSNVDIATANANVTVSIAGTSNVAVFSTGGLAVTGNITGNGIPTTTVSNTAPVNPEQGDIWIVGNTGVQLIYFTSGGNSQWAEMEAATTIEIAQYGNANVANYLPTYGGNITGSRLDISSAGNTWIISGEKITSPDGGEWRSDTLNNDEYLTSGLDGYINLQSLYANGVVASQVHLEHGLAHITANNGTPKVWNFYGNAVMEAPGAITATGNITANYLIGNGSQLTGLPAGYSDSNVVTLLSAFGSNTVSTTGNITANYFIGNGSQLTGISTSTSQIFSGTSNVDIATANANVTVGVNNTSNITVFSTQGIAVTGNGSFTGNVTVNNGAAVAKLGQTVAFIIAYGA